MEVDMRSSDTASLTAIDAKVIKALDQALADENARWSNRGRLTMEQKLVGDRPAGNTPASAPIVLAAIGASRALGLNAALEEGSTDTNIADEPGNPGGDHRRRRQRATARTRSRSDSTAPNPGREPPGRCC